MKKTLRSILTLALAAALVLSSLSACFAAEEEKPYTVLMLGDSTNMGYATKAYCDDIAVKNKYYARECAGFYCITKGSTPDLLNQYLSTIYDDVKMYQYGIAGARPYDMRYFLDSSYPADGFFTGALAPYLAIAALATDLEGQDPSLEEMGEYFRGMYQSAVKEADLVVIELGANDLLTYPNGAHASRFEPDIKEMLKTLKYGADTCEVRNQILKQLSGFLPSNNYSLLPKEIQKLIDAYVIGYLDATAGIDQLVACIKDLNPNAKVVVAGMHDMTEGECLRVSDDFVFPFGAVTTVLTEMVNTYRRSISPYRTMYYFADMDGLDINTMSEELEGPIEDYNADDEYMIGFILRYLGLNEDELSLDDAAKRIHELLNATNIINYQPSDVPMMVFCPDYLEEFIRTGCELSEEEYADAAEIVEAVSHNHMCFGVHPSTDAYKIKFKAFKRAVDAAGEKPALAFNFSNTFKKLSDISFSILEQKIELKTVIKESITNANLKPILPKFVLPFGIGR